MKSLFRNLTLSLMLALTALVITAPFTSHSSQAASLVFDSYWDDLNKGNIVPNSDTFYCTLHTSSFSANKGTMTKRSDLTNEVTGTGYTAGGTPCTLTVSLDTTNHRSDVTITGPSWSTATLTAHYMVISKHRGGASSADNLVSVIDFGADVTSTASTFQVTVSSPIRIQN